MEVLSIELARADIDREVTCGRVESDVGRQSFDDAALEAALGDILVDGRRVSLAGHRGSHAVGPGV